MRVVLLAGAGVSAAMGILLGTALHPNLAADSSFMAPQMQLGGGAFRADSTGDATVTLASYHGTLPDYVLGTDVKTAMAGPDPQEVADASPIVVDEPTPTPVEVHHAVSAADDAVDASDSEPAAGG